ncbi:MAG: dihydroorotase [Treponema sp.]|jgi:dihydroorotase|nr:dihydroorotase [Treponema sp.]
MVLVLKNFRLVDETIDAYGSVVVEDGIIREVYSGAAEKKIDCALNNADIVLNGGAAGMGCNQGGSLVLMPAFVDLHAHFREPGFSAKETIESACLAAAAGGYGTVVCMANTNPVTDTIAQAQFIKNRSDTLGLIDLYPALSLTKGMEGKEPSEITLLQENQNKLSSDSNIQNPIRLVSEDGKDVVDEKLFLATMTEACRIGVPVSCHCDLDGENSAAKRAIELGEKTGCRLHIAHVSAKETAAMIRETKKNNARLSCEVTPHHIALTEKDAAALGSDSFGRVNPPLRTEEDRRALIGAITDGTIDAIATDHAPHTTADKESGAPGFSGLETAFAVCYSTLVAPGHIGLSKLSSLMSAEPARILSLGKGNGGRGRIAPELRADFAIVDIRTAWTVDAERFKSRGKNSPFRGRELHGTIVQTIHNGLCIM